MVKILVVGGAGYIGAHVCKALAARGDAPIVFDNLSSGHEHAVKWGPLVRGDVCAPDDLDRAFSEHAPDAVMHFASNIEGAEGERAPLRFWRNNVGGAVSLLSAMERAGVRRVVFSSSCAVYGAPKTVPITERQACNPISVYGRTKRAVEDILSDAARAGQASYAALRYFNAAGASPDGEIGEEHDPETHLIPNALKAAAGLSGPLHLFGEDYDTPDGACVRDYVHVSDLAQGHLKALDRLMAGETKTIANLGGGQGASVKQVLRAVESVTGLKAPYVVRPRRVGDAPVLTADLTHARKVLGFAPKRSDIETIIADAWRFHKRAWGV